MSADTSSYLASARTTSIAMILAVFFVAQLGVGLFQRMALLTNARQGLVAVVLGDRPGSGTCIPSAERQNYAPSGPLTVEDFGTLAVTLNEYTSGSIGWQVTARQNDGREWTLYTGGIPGFCLEGFSFLRSPGDRRQLGTVAEKLRIDADAAPGLLYGRVEAELVAGEVDAPGVGIRVTRTQATWFIAFATIVFMTLIRHYVRQGLIDPEGALDEPWILLDGRRGLEGLVARSWAILIALAPWIANGTLLETVVIDYLVFVPQTHVITDAAVVVALSFLLATGAWLSVTVLSDLLRLRKDRLASWYAQHPPAGEAQDVPAPA